PLPAGKVYELWLMPSDGSAPIPAGTFTPDASGNATLIASNFQKVAAKGFAITAEPAGGSQTPTLPILLVGGV
ncbi:MAG: anti-sigma factor, partial [Terriglobus roseus]|nr:anti-sigma factor [Terriglobus roseus]